MLTWSLPTIAPATCSGSGNEAAEVGGAPATVAAAWLARLRRTLGAASGRLPFYRPGKEAAQQLPPTASGSALESANGGDDLRLTTSVGAHTPTYMLSRGGKGKGSPSTRGCLDAVELATGQVLWSYCVDQTDACSRGSDKEMAAWLVELLLALQVGWAGELSVEGVWNISWCECPPRQRQGNGVAGGAAACAAGGWGRQI